MSANVLLNLLNELGKEIKVETCQAFYLFFAMSTRKMGQCTHFRTYHRVRKCLLQMPLLIYSAVLEI